ASLGRRIESLYELGRDSRDERLESLVVTPLLRVQHAVAVDDPADVAWSVRPQEIRTGDRLPRLEQLLHRAYCLTQAIEALALESAQEPPHLVVRAGVERFERGASRS